MRLDVYLTEKGYCESRKKASDIIKAGNVFVCGRCVQKAAFDLELEKETEIKIIGDICQYVGRGGLKLERAIECFKIDVSGLVCADIGASTGGFTDCLLQRGAKKVYAVDSGKDQLHKKLRQDERVVCMEETNARYLTSDYLGEKCDLAVMDVSFISQTLLYGSVSNILKDSGRFISLIKPQFEAGRENIGKKGIVKDEKVRRAVCDNIKAYAEKSGFECIEIIDSPILGGDGNKEFLALFEKRNSGGEE